MAAQMELYMRDLMAVWKESLWETGAEVPVRQWAMQQLLTQDFHANGEFASIDVQARVFNRLAGICASSLMWRTDAQASEEGTPPHSIESSRPSERSRHMSRHDRRAGVAPGGRQRQTRTNDEQRPAVQEGGPTSARAPPHKSVGEAERTE